MTIEEALKQRILILDGAMGTKIQSLCLTADDYHRGDFAQWPVSLTGNNEVLCLTCPEVIARIHNEYIGAGADIITTNTFSANRISQHDYECEDLARKMALAGASIARSVADSHHECKVWVAGSMGPMSKSLTLAADMNKPAWRPVDFDEMAAAYAEQAEALLKGGADMLLLETCFDALNTKAALYAIQQLGDRLGRDIPVMVSATINDRSGRTLTGQTLDAFFVSVSHYPRLISFGLNCGFGVTDLRPIVEHLSPRIPVALSLHPNAGLPNEMGEYDELPAYTASHLKAMAEAGLLNIAGGCCGTDERHIRAISEALHGLAPRQIPETDHAMQLSGLEALSAGSKGDVSESFLNIGERTNVAGSRKFARLIAEKKYDEALSVARQQIEGGARIIDINMDDGMLDSRHEMEVFCRHISNDPAIARSVLMIDSSDWDTVLAGLKNAQGKCIVNSISLKNGEKDFLDKARTLRRLGAAVVVMAFDEEGQATTYERKIAIAQRAYELLAGIGFPPQDIIFDVNILSVGTGLPEHQAYAIDFLRAIEWIKEHLPLAKTSGGVSNLSFSFRGNNRVRQAMHSAFLYHAIGKGLDMAIVNPAMLQIYDDIEPRLLKAVEDVIMNTDDGATERLIAVAQEETQGQGGKSPSAQPDDKKEPEHVEVEKRLTDALTKGYSDNLERDILEALEKYGSPIEVIEKPLMRAMEHVGKLFGEGKMFLPQVVRSAKVMKEAVDILQPAIDAGNVSSAHQRPRVVIATANGDVHDIGKNIVRIVLECNGFDVHDLGVMVPAEKIVEETQRLKPCFVGISGLITPSLKEMEELCRQFQREELTTPIVVGGATTSAKHTALRLAPLYDGCVAYGGDASQTSLLAKQLQTDEALTTQRIKADQQHLREAVEKHPVSLTPYEEANRRAPQHEWPSDGLTLEELRERVPDIDIPIDDVASYIDWRMFLLFWGFKGENLAQQLVNPEASRTLSEGKETLRRAIESQGISLKTVVRVEAARRCGNDIVMENGTILPMLRSQSETSHWQCLADYFPNDSSHALPFPLFTLVARPTKEAADDEERLMTHAICARLTEAAAEWLQDRLYGTQHALRIAFGYATCPDHSLKRVVFDLLDAERQLNITLTDHFSIEPSTSICGFFVGHPDARYFSVGTIGQDQQDDYNIRYNKIISQ